MDYKVKDISLSHLGEEAVYLAEQRMPTLLSIRREFEKKTPLSGVTIGACLHITRETAVLARALRAGGAEVVLCASNPLSTQDEVAALLAKEGFHIYAWRGESESDYYGCIDSVIKHHPQILIDDGADLIVKAHLDYPEILREVWGASEETTTGVIRLRNMEREGVLKIPVIATNNAKVKFLFDNRYGTGQGIVAAIRALNVLFAGKTVVIAGYGWCSKGMAMRARGLGANVIVTEVDPIKALEAVMDGYRVMPMIKAVKEADMIFTSTGCKDVVTKAHFLEMKDGAILANLGHFNVEISIRDLEEVSIKKRKIAEFVEEYTLPDGRRLYLLAEGRLANLVCLGGHPSEVMDLSFSVQALVAEYLSMNHEKLEPKVYDVPSEIDSYVAKLKLKTLGIEIDSLTPEQQSYLASYKSVKELRGSK